MGSSGTASACNQRQKIIFLIHHHDNVIWLSATVSHLINASTHFLIFKFSKYALGTVSTAASSNTSNFLCPRLLHNKQCKYRFTISSWIFGERSQNNENPKRENAINRQTPNNARKKDTGKMHPKDMDKNKGREQSQTVIENHIAGHWNTI